jgi:hypothetical protein
MYISLTIYSLRLAFSTAPSCRPSTRTIRRRNGRPPSDRRNIVCRIFIVNQLYMNKYTNFRLKVAYIYIYIYLNVACAWPVKMCPNASLLVWNETRKQADLYICCFHQRIFIHFTDSWPVRVILAHRPKTLDPYPALVSCPVWETRQCL